jgi:hypothetical protein
VTDQIWNVLGALTIFAAMAASHPLDRAQTEALRERIATGWQQMATLPCGDTTPGADDCLPAYWTP